MGPANSGKSTIAKRLKGFKILSDDKTVLKIERNKVRAYAFPERNNFKKINNKGHIIKKVMLLKQAKKAKISEVKKALAFLNLLKSAKEIDHILAQDPNKVFKTSYKICRNVLCHRLEFTKYGNPVKFMK
jgi:hypothetical protein